jgi:hypothetical protein
LADGTSSEVIEIFSDEEPSHKQKLMKPRSAKSNSTTRRNLHCGATLTDGTSLKVLEISSSEESDNKQKWMTPRSPKSNSPPRSPTKSTEQDIEAELSDNSVSEDRVDMPNVHSAGAISPLKHRLTELHGMHSSAEDSFV